MKLTRNFFSGEFNCKHCGAFGINLEFVQALQKLRDQIGRIDVNSGYRCTEHPAEKKKPQPGYHTKGCAADIRSPKLNVKELYEVAVTSKLFAGLGPDAQGKYLHVDTGTDRQRRWTYRDGTVEAWDGNDWSKVPGWKEPNGQSV